MGNPITTAGLTKELAARHRVVMLGGLAVISHGHARPNYHMLDRFLTPKVAEAALSHSSTAVRELGLRFLHELADEGNPFAAEILKKLQ